MTANKPQLTFETALSKALEAEIDYLSHCLYQQYLDTPLGQNWDFAETEEEKQWIEEEAKKALLESSSQIARLINECFYQRVKAMISSYEVFALKTQTDDFDEDSYYEQQIELQEALEIARFEAEAQ